MRSYTDQLFEALKNEEEYYELRVFSLLFEIIHLLYAEGYVKNSGKKAHTRKQTKSILRLLSWIEEHFSEHITLEDLARVSGMNEKYVCRIFKEYTSRSPMRYINELRIDCACHEMTANKKSITQAAYDCGFNDSGYFSKLFKRYKGMTPGEYKKEAASRP